ncbi:MAG: YqzL family protein [Paenibacillaceae bacterium]
MRTFSWEYFTLTGDVDAYLLYKDMHLLNTNQDAEDEFMDEEDQQTTGNLI